MAKGTRHRVKIDLAKFERALPYAAEAFGVYQPLLGWRSQRVARRIRGGLEASFSPVMRTLMTSLKPALQFDHPIERTSQLKEILVASPQTRETAYVNANIDSFVAREIASRINTLGLNLADDTIWEQLVGRDALIEILRSACEDPALRIAAAEFVEHNPDGRATLLTNREMPYNRESLVAGALNELFEQQAYNELRGIFE